MFICRRLVHHIPFRYNFDTISYIVYMEYIWSIWTRVVKADFLKAVREAVAQRLIKAVKRLLYVVNKTNDCFKMHLTSVRLWASTFHY